MIEIGTWSNDMANDIDAAQFSDEENEEAEFMKGMPANVSFCKHNNLTKPETFKTENQTLS